MYRQQQTLSMYFEIEDQSKIGVEFKLLNLFGKHSVVCENLRLKPQIINTNTMMVIVKQCKIHRLEIVIDSSKQQLLSAKVSGVYVSLKFNPQVQPQSPTKTLQKPQIQQFKKILSSQENFQKIEYFESSPFKRMLMEQLLRKINVNVQNVDICLFYSDSPNAKCVGIKLDQLNICQRQVINRSKNGQHQKQQEIQCKLNGLGLYLGISVGDNDLMVRENFRKQVLKQRQRSIRKRFFLEKNQLVVYYNQGNNTLTVLSELIEFNMSAFYVRQFLEIVNKVNPLLSKSPKIRPGEGKKLTSGKYTFSQGTAQWWKYIGMKLVQKIKQKQQLNIIQNRQYRLYLYCLLYCYTYGGQTIYLNYIQNAQKFKKPKHIMNSHKFIIQKIYKIQHKHLDHLQQMQLRGFVSFLSMKPKKKEGNNINGNGKNNGFLVGNNIWQELMKLSQQKTLDYNDVKKIKYEDIKKSKVFINFSNCVKFMTEYEKQSKNILSIFLRLKSFKINLVETKQEIKMHKQMYAEHPQHFHLVKRQMMESYYLEHIRSGVEEQSVKEEDVVKTAEKKQKLVVTGNANKKKLQEEKIINKKFTEVKNQLIPIISFTIQNTSMQLMQNRFSLTIGQIKARQSNYKQKIIDIKNITLTNLALQKYSQKEGRIISVGNQLDFRIVSVYINFTVKTAQKLLMVYTLIMDKLNGQQTTQNQSNNDHNFVSEFMSKKIKPDLLFSNNNQSIHALIQSITLVTPTFDKDRIFHLNLNKLQCDYPSYGTKTISLQRIQVKRSSFENLKNQSWKKLGENESIILQNDRSFTVLISESYTQKVDPQYFNFVKSYSTKIAQQKKPNTSSYAMRQKIQPMIEHDAKSVFNLIIPFLFVQLACEDVYYMMLVGKYWSQLMRNPYIFKPKLKTKQALQQVNKSSQLRNTTYQFIKQIEKNTKILFETHITLNGFEFIFNGDKGISDEDEYTGKNRILTIMIDSICYDFESRLKDDTTKIKIKNMYVRNMLGSDQFNIQGLQDIFKQYIQRKQPLITRKSDNFLQQSYLIMYNHYMEDFQVQDKVPFLDITITNQMNIEKLKGHNDISINVKAFQIFHEPKFMRKIVQMINKLSLISQKHYEQTRGKFFQKSFIRENNQLREFQIEQKYMMQNKEILYSKDFSIINSMSVNLQKVNLIVLLQNDPVYCIALDSIAIKHKTESYITVYNIQINELYIMDVSVASGPHSMIIQSTIPIHVNYTQYNCQLLKQRYKRSALMTIEINRAIIHFLNKKVMEFINFINQLKQDIFGKSQPASKKAQKQNTGEYPFCYEIIIVDSKVVLYRNSLSKQKLQGKIGTLTVTNYKSRNFEQTMKRKTMTIFNRQSSMDANFMGINNNNNNHNHQSSQAQPVIPNSQRSQQNIIDETHYEQMSQISQNNFKSFLQESFEQQISDYIYIDLYSLTIDGRHRKKDILFAQKMHMTFRDIYFKIFIPQINFSIDNDDFRLLIRLTEENFGQQDRYFHINPIFKTEKYEKFVTEFHIVVTKMQCYKGDYGIYQGKDIQHSAQKSEDQPQQQSLNILTLIDLRGKDVSFINGEKYNEIEIQKIFAQDENMNQFIERYNKSQNDPIIHVQPKTISQSQKYFTKFSKVFDVFSKLGQEGELVLSDFDYKQEQILNRPDRGKVMKIQTQQASNCEKLMKWLRGMCDKCFWWTKKEMQVVNPHQIAKAILDKQVERRRKKDFNMVNQHTLFCNGDYNLSHIFSDKQMIRLQNKISPQTFYPLYDPKYSNQLYFRMDMQTTKDKKMYILAKDLIMTYEPSGGLLDLAEFFGKPYGAYQDYDPPFVASNFNNFRPAQMYMQLKDSKLQMKKQIITKDDQDFQKIQSVQKIVIFLDLIYNMQTMGDMIKGPGRSIKQADIILKLCHSVCKQGTQSFIQLSNLIQMIYQNQANVSYKKRDKTKFDQKIILKPYFDKDKSVNFYIPTFSIKSLMEIYNANFNVKKQEQSQKDKQKVSSQEDMRMNRRQSYESIKAGHTSSKKQKIPKTQQLASKIDQKKQKIKQKDVQSSITNRKIYLQSLCINLQSKIRTSFIKLHTNNLMFVNIYENMIYTEKSKMQLNSQLAIDYWNLHLLDFEPFLQPWNSKLIMKNIKRENTLSKKIKLQSFNRALEVDNYQQKNLNNNWLNLNLSMAFFHTFKQLQLKYYQGKDQRQQQCIDVTFTQISNFLKLPYKQSQTKIKNALKQFVKKQNFPQAMKNFFGRRFIMQSQAMRKKGENRQNFFHQYGTVYNLYHSYFDHQKRKKTICYRTPFRILNCFSDHITVKIKIKHNSSTIHNPKYIQFEHQLKKGEYLALPALIYRLDFLIAFEYAHKHHQAKQGVQKSQLKSIRSDDQQIILDEQDEDRFLSAQYLMQVHSQKSDFRKDKNSKILKKLFSQDSKKDRYLDSRDILIKSGKKVFALVCTKSEYDNDREKSKIRFYDTLLAIVTPIQLYNYCPLQLTVILNGRNQYRLPCNRSTYISSQLNVNNIHQTVIQFRQHILHRQFTFLKKENQNHTYYMQLDRMQSVNVRVIKQTTSTFSIEIFADWILENHTQEEFQIDYETKIFPLDKLSTNSIAIENYYHGKKIQLEISLYSPDNTKNFSYEVVTNATQTVQIITLYKKVPQIQKIKLLQRKKNLKVRGRCCIKTYPFTEKTKEKQSDEIYKVYSFVMKIANYEHCNLTKTLSIGYKTKMKNTTNKLLTLYQYNDKFKIEQLQPDQEICVWMFDFLPEYFVVEKRQMIDIQSEISNYSMPKNISQPFRFDQSLGKMFTIRFRQGNSRGSTQWQYHRNFSYIKIQIKQHDHCSLYEFTQIDANSSDQFPIYIHNTTQEMIKIYQNTQSFYVKPRSKVPFSWSNLINNNHEIDVQINQVKKTYSFKMNQQFQPIIIKDEHVQHNKPTIQQPKTNFHKQVCRVKYGLIEGKFQTIIDIKENCLIILPGLQGIEYKFDMKQAVKMTISAQSIQLNLGPKKQPLILYPSNQTFQTWLSYLNYTINQDIVSKISFTIETYKNSRLFFFHNVELGRQNDYLTSSQNYFIENLYISVINERPQQVILLYMGEITFQRDNRICRLGYDDYQIQKCDRKLQVKQIKINNQLENAVNPVILTQIKKSKTPFISIITKKRNLVKSKQDLQAFQFRDEMITHFQSFRFFLDEAQAMVEASLIPKLLGLKNQMERVQTQYKIQEQEEYHSRMQRQQSQRKQRRVSNTEYQNNKNTQNKQKNKFGPQPSPSKQQQQKQQQQQSSYQLYMSFLQIRPIKMTVSVSFDTLSKDEQQDRMNMELLNMLPVGIENAIITIDSYIFHHIYEDKEQVMKQINQFYKSQLTKQVLINAGNLEFLFAVDLIKNLGIGVKNIFYDPIYEFASNKDIKNTTSTLLQGLFSLVLFIISFFVKIVNLIFKIFAISTFDTDYKAKRQIFRKQIFKSPLDGVIFGGKYFWKIFKSFKQDFVRIPKLYYEKYSIFGCVFGFILAILNIVPWLIKLFITIYDMIYVIGIGFVSWGHYQQNAMKNRSRPIRIFHKKKLVPYNLLQAKAYEIMRKHNISLTQKQSILYVRDVDSMEKTTSYLILSDYSLLYCNNRLSIFDQIILYKVFQFRVIYPQQKKKPKAKSVCLQISLKSPNIRKFLFLEFTKYTYVIKFKCYEQLLELLDKLQQLKEQSQELNKMTQKYDFTIVDDKKMFNKEEIKKMRKMEQPLEYKEMDYLQGDEDKQQSQDAILNQVEFRNNKKKEVAI